MSDSDNDSDVSIVDIDGEEMDSNVHFSRLHRENMEEYPIQTTSRQEQEIGFLRKLCDFVLRPDFSTLVPNTSHRREFVAEMSNLVGNRLRWQVVPLEQYVTETQALGLSLERTDIVDRASKVSQNVAQEECLLLELAVVVVHGNVMAFKGELPKGTQKRGNGSDPDAGARLPTLDLAKALAENSADLIDDADWLSSVGRVFLRRFTMWQRCNIFSAQAFDSLRELIDAGRSLGDCLEEYTAILGSNELRQQVKAAHANFMEAFETTSKHLDDYHRELSKDPQEYIRIQCQVEQFRTALGRDWREWRVEDLPDDFDDDDWERFRFLLL